MTTQRSSNGMPPAQGMAQGRPRTLVGSGACPPGRSRSGRRRTSRTSAPRSRCPTAARRDASSRSATTRRRSSRTTWKRRPTGSGGPRRTRRPATTPTPTATSGRWCATAISPGHRAHGPACDRTRDCRGRPGGATSTSPTTPACSRLRSRDTRARSATRSSRARASSRRSRHGRRSSARSMRSQLNREHHLGHAELCTTKSDPGAGFPWDELLEAIAERLAAVSVEARLAAVEQELAALLQHTHGVPLPA